LARDRGRLLFDCLVILALLAVFWALVYGPQFLTPVRLALALLLLARACRPGRFARWQPADYAAAALAFTYVMRISTGADTLTVSRIEASLTGILGYAAIRTASRQTLVSRVVFLCCGLAAVQLSAVSIVTTFGWMSHARQIGFDDVTALKGLVPSLLRGPVNEWAAILLGILILQIAFLRPTRGMTAPLSMLTLTGVVINATALSLTFSRSAYISVVFALSVLAAMALRSGSRFRQRALLALIGAVFLAAFIGDRLSAGGVRRTAGLVSSEQQRRSASGRMRVWSGALELVPAHWAFGSGPGTFARRFVPKAGLGEYRSYVGRPLNTPLAILVEEGAIGLSLHLLFPIAAIVPLLFKSQKPAWRPYALEVLALGAAVVWFREMTFSSMTENPLVGWLYWILVGSLVRASATARLRRRVRSDCLFKIAMAAGAVALGFLLFLEPWRQVTESWAAAAARELANGDIGAAREDARKAAESGASPYYVGLSGLAEGVGAMPSFNLGRLFEIEHDPAKQILLRRALDRYNAALALNPDDETYWHNRGWVRLRLGEAESQVIADFQKAVAIDGGGAPYRCSLGLLYERIGEPKLALEQYAAAVAAAPEVAASPFWQDLKRRAPTQWSAAFPRAEGLLRAKDPHGADSAIQARLASVYLENGSPETARRILVAVTATMPQYSRAWSNLARVYLRAGAADDAERCVRMALFLDHADPVAMAVQKATLQMQAGDGSESPDETPDSAPAAMSAHASRVPLLYGARSPAFDDLLPHGWLKYCGPQLERIE
jgi:tetratricopeptide (TPR) repeat protein